MPSGSKFRRRKYRNNPVYITPAGVLVGRGYEGPKTKVFDSAKEYRRFVFLYGELRAGRISGLRTQVRFPLHGPRGRKLTTYVADFVYILNGRRIVEDVKSPMTRKLRLWQIKRDWMADEYGITVHES